MTKPLNPTPPDQADTLENALRELTTDRGPETRLWENALAQIDAEGKSSMSTVVLAKLHSPLPRTFLSIAALIAISLVMLGFLLPSLGRARYSSPAMASRAAERTAQIEADMTAMRAKKTDTPASGWIGPQSDGPSGGANADIGFMSPTPSSAPAPALSRSVIRKATLELDTPDVRAVFAKAQLSIRPELGEYIESSSLNGESKDASAQITLRFAATRMDAAMNDLRQLGTVKAETASGDDVTEQVVDLDARLRNERRVEQEVLALLESRKDAPLKEILELRDKLAGLRQNIEQLQARKDNLARQVALATVLVIIRPDNALPEPKSQLAPIGAYFADQFSDSWRTGTLFLADTLALFARMLIGGLPWWILLAALAFFVRRHLRRIAAPRPG